jgi:adenosylmethionine-8-amino-7-oxononanoate aminotransferase
MTETKMMDESSHLILHRTSKAELRQGITVLKRGEGVRVFDQDGKSYIDVNSGITRPVHIGHGREEVAQAAFDQMTQLAYFTPMGFATQPAIDLAQKLSEITPPTINKFTFECGGSEAVETAMKLAKSYHFFRGDKGRFKIISRKGAYLGVNGHGARALGVVPGMRQIMEPLAPGGIFADSPYCFRCAHNLTYPDCDIECARAVEHILEFEGPDQISVFIGEPIQQGFGAYAPPEGYWPTIREICDQHGILLILDEVICGFGRTGKMFATEHFNVKPDLITMAKGLTSGYLPLGAVGCTDAVMEPIDIFSHLHTYGNHPVSCNAALKNIEIIETENLVENSAEMGRYFLEALESLTTHPSVGEVRGNGLWLAVDFTTDKNKRADYPMASLLRMIASAKQKGVLMKSMGQALEFAPPLVINKEEIDEVIRVLEKVVSEEEKNLGL